MSDFIIQIRSNRVQANRVIGGKIESILFAGEKHISVDGFWDDFKRKIEYVGGERLAFIFISDLADVELDPKIIVAEQFDHHEQDIAELIEELNFPGATIVCYPQIELVSEYLQSTQVHLDESIHEIERDVIESEDLLPNTSIQTFYRKKTRGYKHG